MDPRIRGVLFDLDGTLADTLVDLANATNWALAHLGCSTHSPERYRYMVGDGARQLCARALPSDRQELIGEAVKLMRSRYATHWAEETRLYPGITEVVLALAAAGYKLAVLSNKPDDFTKQIVSRYFQPNPFQAIRGQQPSTPLKPDPTAALEIARQLDVPPSHWTYLGDTNTDMQTACAAGMFPVGVLWGFRDRDELLENGAQALVERPEQILALLNKRD